MRRLKTVLSVVGLIALLTPTEGARAAALFDNLTQPFYGADGVSNSLYASFSTGNQAVDLTSVALDLFQFGTTGTVYVTILNDAAGTPGSLLGYIGLVSDSVLPAYSGATLTPTTFSTPFYSPSTIPLSPNTRYWINVYGTASSAYWADTNSTSGTGLTGEYDQNAHNGTSSTLDTSGPTVYMMGINVPADPVPEPTSIAILGVGLLGLGLIRRSKSGNA